MISPLPPNFFWNGFIFPSTIVMLLSGASKFFIFDNQICHALLWLPKEGEPIPQKAEECHASRDLTVTLCACILSLVSIILVYARTPKRRPLDETFGRKYIDLADSKNDEIMAVVPVDTLDTLDTMEDSVCISALPDDAESQKEVAVSNTSDYLKFLVSPEPILSKASTRSTRKMFNGSWRASVDEDSSTTVDNNKFIAGHPVERDMRSTSISSNAIGETNTHDLDYYENNGGDDDSKSAENIPMKFVANVIW